MNNNQFKEFRKHVPLTEKWAYFETAGTGLIPDFVYDGVNGYQQDRYFKGGDSHWIFPDGKAYGTLGMMERAKIALAKMTGSSPEEIAFGQNSSHLFTLFTEGLDFKPGDNIVLPEDGWISNRFAWQMKEREGVELRYAKARNGQLAAEDIIRLCDENTRAVSVAYVESATGFRADAAAIGRYCREQNIWFAVDAVQALGVLPVDVNKLNIDFMVGNDYKWMMNYCGCGYAYIRRELWDKLSHWGAGWMSDDERFDTSKADLRLRNDAGRFELGYPSASGIFGLGMVAEKYNELGGEHIETYVMKLMDYLYDGIEGIDGVAIGNQFANANRSAIANLIIEQELAITDEILEKAGIFAHVRSLGVDKSQQMIRVSLHYYNNEQDIDRLLHTLGRRG